MKKLSRTFITISFLLSMLLIHGMCGSSMFEPLAPEEIMLKFFQQNLAGNEGLFPFYYTTSFLNSDQPDPGKMDQHCNCREWQAFTRGAATEKDIFLIQYNLSTDAFVYAYNTNDWSPIASNTFVRWLIRPENKAAIDYFCSARKVENALLGDRDPWAGRESWESGISNSGYDSLIAQGKEKCKAPVPEFIRERYAFQLIKLMYYQKFNAPGRDTSRFGRFDTLQGYYDAYLKDKNTIVADWGLLFYAISQPDKWKCDFYLLQTFDRCEEKKVYVYLNIKTTDLDTLETKIKDPETLSLIYALRALKNPGKALPQIQKLYAAKPNSPYLRLLITREMNKLEDWLLTPTLNGFGEENYLKKQHEHDRQYLEQVCNWLKNKIPADSKNNEFLELAVVHMYNIDKNYSGAAAYLCKMPRLKEAQLNTQRQIEETITLINAKDISSPEVQAELNVLFEKLESAQLNKGEKNEYWQGKGADVVSAFYLMMSKKFQKAGDIVNSGILFNKAALVTQYYNGSEYYKDIAFYDDYAKPADLDSLLRFINKPVKTAFEKRISHQHWGEEDAYRDLKATLLLRQGKMEEALAVVENIPDSFWATRYEFDEYLRVRNITSLGGLLPVKTGHTVNYTGVSKKAILRDMVHLRAALKTTSADEERARIYFLLGNCYYNITYWGKDWMMYSYGKSSGETRDSGFYNRFNFSPFNPQYDKIYYECAWAREMYKNALEKTKDKELAARCAIMLALCDKEAFYHKARSGYGYGLDLYLSRHPYTSPWLKFLKSGYVNTELFAKAVTNCPDIAEFAAK